MPISRRTLLLLAILAGVPATGQDTALGSFRDWSAVVFGSGEGKTCMAFTQPAKSQGNYTRRGEAFIFVTHRPGVGERGRVSLDTGYPYRAGSTATVIVGQLVLELRTEGSTAWLDDESQTARLLGAMRAGRELRVEGTSSRGTKTIDHYSLFGFTAAQQAIDEACP